MNAKTVKELQAISTPKHFPKDEYICYEGQPGNEMYIILKGLVGVYLTSAIGTLTEVAKLKDGEFFGEMALFDNLPRSASCIALEDTVCVAINKDNLMGFLISCPDMTEKILEHLSARIRKLNNDLYKNPQKVKKERNIPKFSVPAEYGFSHMVKEPYQEPKILTIDRQDCPICGGTIRIVDMKRHLMKVKKMDTDCRIEYLACEPLWHDVISCPHCYYTNYHLDFFKVNPMMQEQIRTLLKEEHVPVVEQKGIKRTQYDVLVLNYLQAIHINEHINGSDNALLGTLWLKLYWLAKDPGDEKFTKYCAEKTIQKLQTAIDEDEIEDKISKCSMALSLANILEREGKDQEAAVYSALAMECPEETILNCAITYRKNLSKKLRSNL